MVSPAKSAPPPHVTPPQTTLRLKTDPKGLVSTPGAAGSEFPQETENAQPPGTQPHQPLTVLGFSSITSTDRDHWRAYGPERTFPEPTLRLPHPPELPHTSGPHLPLGGLGKRSQAVPAGRVQAPAEHKGSKVPRMGRGRRGGAVRAGGHLPGGLHLERWERLEPA